MNIAQPKALSSRRAVSAIALGLWFFGMTSAYCSEPPADDRASLRDIQFVRDVQPILQRHCYSCHGESKQRSGLRLDVREAALRGGDGYGPSIIAGDVDSSPLIQLITADSSDERMPPEGDGLSPSEIETLTEWIRSGAEWPLGVDLAQLEDRLDHWAFKPLRINHDQRSIDDFLLAKLEEQGLSFAVEADSDIWLRRVTFDLTGLPPTLEEIDEFQSRLRHATRVEDRLLAYRDVVEGLLSSERYGERWAQHWLDVVRYADTHGFEVNTERPNAWPYRDYVIRAFNQDTAYDQFIREQLVGDALGQDAATGFLVTASVLLPGQIGKDAASIRLARQDALDEIVNNVSQTFIALSVGCARCHDHKFDPISARDYYGMQALVAGVEYEEREIYSQEAEYLRRQTSALRERFDSIQDQLAGLSPIAQPKSQGDEKLGDTSLSSDGVVRPAVGAGPMNVDRFLPRNARRLRFTVLSTNSLEPCLDELEVFNTQGKNIALASMGTQATTSGDIRVANRHDPSFVNDGQYGNESSWLGNVTGGGWIELEFSEQQEIERVVWSRDREGVYGDRLAIEYRIEISCDDSWQLVADSSDRRPHIAGMSLGPAFTLEGLAPDEVELAEALLAEIKSLQNRLKSASSGQVVFAGKFRQPDTIYLLARGDPEQPRDEVQPAVPSGLGEVAVGSEQSEQERRRALAEWIASPENPLTARVMVNRVWQGHFGRGLVSTPSDFGRNGDSPSHPELLDWLAEQFIRSGWSVKQLHRWIVLSKAYRQSSAIDSRALEIDADGRWLWRYPSRRREAESIRDSMLAVSGRLDTTMYGPGFNLFDKRGGLSGFEPVESLNDENQRRMIYAHKVRRETEAVFGAFDCPDAGQSIALRRDTTTPIQALNLMNSRFTLETSAALAVRVESEVGSDVAAQIDRAYRLTLGRLPSAQEREEAEPAVRQHGLVVLYRALFNCNEFLFIP